ncbi:MAG: Asp-tRNA(Asn)/Glu-tRNA(Gln) amidotransferase subunit GatC [Candidatus Syntropharchaeia archaeon]
MITKEVISHLCWLSRIELKEEEMGEFIPQLNEILEYFEMLDEVEEEVPPTYHVLGITNVFREDIARESMDQSLALMNAPKKENGYFKGPRII